LSAIEAISILAAAQLRLGSNAALYTSGASSRIDIKANNAQWAGWAFAGASRDPDGLPEPVWTHLPDDLPADERPTLTVETAASLILAGLQRDAGGELIAAVPQLRTSGT
ncbi:hypothetical protein V6O07_09750, partial [Arthrospira platensis SPKY2]